MKKNKSIRKEKLFKILKNIKKIFSKIKKDSISEFAAESAYFTILSFIPFVIFFLTLIKFINIEKNTILIVFKEFVPSSMHFSILSIIDEIYSKSTGVMSFSLIIAIWSAGKGFFSLSKGVKKIYTVDDESNFFLRIKGSLYTLILIILIIIFLIIIIIGNKIYIYIMSNFQQVSKIVYLLYKFRIIFSTSVIYFIFLFLYKFISDSKKDEYDHNYGALFVSIFWQLISLFFSVYMQISDGFTNMYGSLSSLILIMFWIYGCMYLTLLGAEINVIFGKRYVTKTLETTVID